MLPPVLKPQDFQTLGDVDIIDLLAFQQRLTDNIWQQENQLKENNFACFHHTQHIIFCFIKDFGDPKNFYSNPIWEIAKPIFLPAMHKVIEAYQFSNPVFPKAMLAKLQAGHVIDAHHDGAGSNLLTHKIHIPLITHPDILMHINGKSLHLEAGKAYEVNNIAKHAVSNHSTVDRVHFIFEVFDNL